MIGCLSASAPEAVGAKLRTSAPANASDLSIWPALNAIHNSQRKAGGVPWRKIFIP